MTEKLPNEILNLHETVPTRRKRIASLEIPPTSGCTPKTECFEKIVFFLDKLHMLMVF